MSAADLQTFTVLGQDVNRSIAPIVREIRRPVRERILTAQIILYLSESIGDVGELKWLE